LWWWWWFSRKASCSCCLELLPALSCRELLDLLGRGGCIGSLLFCLVLAVVVVVVVAVVVVVLVPTKEATSTCPRCDLKRHSKVVVAAVAVWAAAFSAVQSPVV